MSRERVRRVGLVAALIAAAGAVALVGVVAGVDAGGAPGQVSDQPEADNSVTRIAVRTDGSATWTIRVRTRLETDEDVAAFEAFRDRFRENRSRYLDPFRDNVRSVVSSAADETGREMAAANFSAETSVQAVPRRWGIVTYEFTWSGFAAAEADRIVVGDVFGSGFFIEAEDSLQIAAPEGYRVGAANPDPDSIADGTATWEGRRDFADGRPRVTFEPAADAATDTAAGERTTTATPTGASGGAPVWLAVLAAGLALGAGFVAVRRRGDIFVHRTEGDGAASTPVSEGRPRPGDSPADGERVDAAPPSEPGTPSDEETVVELLADNGGRMKQSDLVETVDWSKSKVSRVLSELEDDGLIEKSRIGRENLVELVEE